MKKRFIFVMLFLLVLSANAQNLLVNPNFETGDLTGWNTWNNGITKNASEVYNGTTSGVLNAGSTGSLQQWIRLESNTKYVFSVWGKVSNSGESATLLVHSHGYDQEFVVVNSTEYQQFSLIFETGTITGDATLSLYKSVASYGKIFCDDFQLYKGGDEVVEIQLNGETNCPVISAGEQYQINPSIIPITALDQSLTWSIAEGEGNATVDENGLVTAIAQGTVRIKAAANDGSGVEGFYDLQIVAGAIQLESIEVSHSNTDNTVYAAKKLQMTTEFTPQYFCDQTVTWSVENLTGKASINSAGILSAEAVGEVKVMAVSNANPAISGEITMTVVLHESNTYYIDATLGADTNDGLSEQSPWKSLAKVNAGNFYPGDSILFKAGEVWTGQLNIECDGIKDHPIVFSRYGSGNKPRINGNGVQSYTLMLKNANYAEASEFEITNKGATAQGGRLGVLLLAQNEGSIYETVIKNLDIHDVNGQLAKANGGGSGILWVMEGDTPSRFVDALIQGNHIYDVDRNGIGGWSTYGAYQGNSNYYSPGMKIRQNLIERIPGDGIVPIGTNGAIVEYNICRDFNDNLPNGDAAAGIWPWNALNTIIQHNEVSGHMASWDGQGFDSDYNCSGTIIQYNYSHDNCGGFLLICSDGQWGGYNNNSIIRYNISVNDGFRTWGSGANFCPAIHIAGNAYNAKVYNNTIYMGPKPASVTKEFVNSANWNGWANKTYFYNNIFYAAEPSTFSMNQSTNNTFSHNLYFGNMSYTGDAKPISGDPLFVNPGSSDDVYNYQLQTNSKALKAGMIIANNGGMDFFGNPVSSTSLPNVGAYNGDGVTVGIEQQVQDETALFAIFPNPMADTTLFLNILRDLENVNIQIHSLTGELMFSANRDSLKSGYMPLDISEYRSGVYLVSLAVDQQSQTLKVIKR
jgi:hypothetical protein